MSPKATQTAAPNGLNFFQGTQGKKSKNMFFKIIKIYFYFTGNAGHFS